MDHEKKLKECMEKHWENKQTTTTKKRTSTLPFGLLPQMQLSSLVQFWISLCVSFEIHLHRLDLFCLKLCRIPSVKFVLQK